MKPILIRLHENEYTKLTEIANSNGHLSKSAAISMLIAQYGTTQLKAKTKKQPLKPEKPKQTECDICGQESHSLRPVMYDNEKVLACELCLSDKDIFA